MVYNKTYNFVRLVQIVQNKSSLSFVFCSGSLLDSLLFPLMNFHQAWDISEYCELIELDAVEYSLSVSLRIQWSQRDRMKLTRNVLLGYHHHHHRSLNQLKMIYRINRPLEGHQIRYSDMTSSRIGDIFWKINRTCNPYSVQWLPCLFRLWSGNWWISCFMWIA